MARKYTRKVRRNRRRTYRKGGGLFNFLKKKPQMPPQQQTFSRSKPENLAIGVRSNSIKTNSRTHSISNASELRPSPPSRESSTSSLPGPVENINFRERIHRLSK